MLPTSFTSGEGAICLLPTLIGKFDTSSSGSSKGWEDPGVGGAIRTSVVRYRVKKSISSGKKACTR